MPVIHCRRFPLFHINATLSAGSCAAIRSKEDIKLQFGKWKCLIYSRNSSLHFNIELVRIACCSWKSFCARISISWWGPIGSLHQWKCFPNKKFIRGAERWNEKCVTVCALRTILYFAAFPVLVHPMETPLSDEISICQQVSMPAGVPQMSRKRRTRSDQVNDWTHVVRAIAADVSMGGYEASKRRGFALWTAGDVLPRNALSRRSRTKSTLQVEYSCALRSLVAICVDNVFVIVSPNDADSCALVIFIVRPPHLAPSAVHLSKCFAMICEKWMRKCRKQIAWRLRVCALSSFVS